MKTSNEIVKNALANAVAKNASVVLGEGDKIRENGVVWTVTDKPNAWAYSVKSDDGKTKMIADGNIKEYKLKHWADFVKNASFFSAGDKVVFLPSARGVDHSAVYTVVSVDGVRGTMKIKDEKGGISTEDQCSMKSANAVANAKFKVGDRVKWLDANDAGLPTGSVVTIRGIENGKYVVYAGMKKNLIDEKELREEYWPAPKGINAAPMSAHEASVLLSGKRRAVTQYSRVEPDTLYYRALGHIFAVPDSDTMRTAIAAVGSRVLPYQVGGVVGNSVVRNYTFKVGDKVKADRPYGIPGDIGVVKAIGLDGDLTVDFGKRGIVRVPCAYAIGLNNRE